jgi:hypothetical protein
MITVVEDWYKDYYEFICCPSKWDRCPLYILLYKLHLLGNLPIEFSLCSSSSEDLYLCNYLQGVVFLGTVSEDLSPRDCFLLGDATSCPSPALTVLSNTHDIAGRQDGNIQRWWNRSTITNAFRGELAVSVRTAWLVRLQLASILAIVRQAPPQWNPGYVCLEFTTRSLEERNVKFWVVIVVPTISRKHCDMVS